MSKDSREAAKLRRLVVDLEPPQTLPTKPSQGFAETLNPEQQAAVARRANILAEAFQQYTDCFDFIQPLLIILYPQIL